MERTKFAKKWEKNKIVGDLIKNRDGTEDRITPLENIQKKVVYGGSLEDLRKVKRTLLTSGDEGKQAWKEIQGSVIQKIKDAATASIAADAEGRQMVSPAKLNSEIFETIYFAALTASNEIAQELGHYETYPGSPRGLSPSRS